MKLAHRISGIAGVVVFLLTGQYLLFRYPDMDRLDTGTRMLLRSRHLYILLAALVNVGIGLYFQASEKPRRRVMQKIGSALVIVAPWMLTAAFFYEPGRGILDMPLSHWALYLLFAGMMLHILSGVRRASREAPTDRKER